jgi:hypothetical protein
MQINQQMGLLPPRKVHQERRKIDDVRQTTKLDYKKGKNK